MIRKHCRPSTLGRQATLERTEDVFNIILLESVCVCAFFVIRASSSWLINELVNQWIVLKGDYKSFEIIITWYE